MKKNTYHIDISGISDKNGEDLSHLETISFDFACHDDLHEIMSRVSSIDGLSTTEKNTLAVGIKMLGEVMLENRKHPLFEEFSRAFGQFMKNLKAQVK